MIKSDYPSKDLDWKEEDWRVLLQELISKNLVTYKDVTSLVLGHINPPQVGTSIASNQDIQSQFPARKAWASVRNWFYNQCGMCVDCKTRLELQVDHVVPIEKIGVKAQTLENLELRCRRCNVRKRPSHANNPKTFLTTESALMWIYFTKQPKTYTEYKQLCRLYGLTMADIRIQEAWAIDEWLRQEKKPEESKKHTEDADQFFVFD